MEINRLKKIGVLIVFILMTLVPVASASAVNPYPHANFKFTPNPVYEGGWVQFTDKSTSAFPIKSWNWHMGFWVNGKEVTSRVKNPKIHYFIDDLIGSCNCKVTLKVTNTRGFTSTATKYVTVISGI